MWSIDGKLSAIVFLSAIFLRDVAILCSAESTTAMTEATSMTTRKAKGCRKDLPYPGWYYLVWSVTVLLVGATVLHGYIVADDYRAEKTKAAFKAIKKEGRKRRRRGATEGVWKPTGEMRRLILDEEQQQRRSARKRKRAEAAAAAAAASPPGTIVGAKSTRLTTLPADTKHGGGAGLAGKAKAMGVDEPGGRPPGKIPAAASSFVIVPGTTPAPFDPSKLPQLADIDEVQLQHSAISEHEYEVVRPPSDDFSEFDKQSATTADGKSKLDAKAKVASANPVSEKAPLSTITARSVISKLNTAISHRK